MGSVRRRDVPERVPKLIGSDFELGNFILGGDETEQPASALPGPTGARAARILLRQIDGVSGASRPANRGRPSSSGDGSAASGWGGDSTRRWTYRSGLYSPARGTRYPARGAPRAVDRESVTEHDPSIADGRVQSSYVPPSAENHGDGGEAFDSQDWGRKFLPSNGACCYIDLNHLEVCTPEVRSARDFVAASRAMLAIAREAMHAAEAELSPGERLVVLANNSDGQGQSYGSHLNFLISRGLWRRLFDRLYPDLFVLAAFQASSIVMTGQGKVGSENHRPSVDYQLSQRADFLMTLQGLQTTYDRPILNTRDEAHCGPLAQIDEAQSPNARYARLHCICFDHTLCQVATFLTVGTMQLVLSLLESGHADPRLILEDPLAAVHTWSHDPGLTAHAYLANGRAVTALELQCAFLDQAKRFANTAGFEEYVPDAAAILELWEDTLAKLNAGSINALRSRLDWVLKRELIELALQQRPGLAWRSPETKHLDLIYSSLDVEESLYWTCERHGLVEHIVTHAEIEHFTRQPPADTRAWTRAWLLRQHGEGRVDEVDWDHVTLAAPRERPGEPARKIRLDDPLGFTKAFLDAELERSPRSDGNERSDSGHPRYPRTKRRRER